MPGEREEPAAPTGADEADAALRCALTGRPAGPAEACGPPLRPRLVERRAEAVLGRSQAILSA